MRMRRISQIDESLKKRAVEKNEKTSFDQKYDRVAVVPTLART